MTVLRRRVLAGLAVLLLAPLLLVGVVVAGLNTQVGQRAAADAAGWLTGGQVEVSGLSGRFPDSLQAARVVLRDADGPWLEIDGLALDWSPLDLLHRVAKIDLLTAARVRLLRLPAPGASTSSGGTPSLPVQVRLAQLRVDRLELAAPVAGLAAVLSVQGHADLPSLQQGAATLAIDRLDAPGRYRLHGTVDDQGLKAHVTAEEPANGIATALAALPALVPAGASLSLDARLDGPWDAAVLDARLAAGPMHVSAKGKLDLVGESAVLDLAASAPAMAPRADLSWESVAITGHLRGTLARPDASAQLRVSGLRAFGTALEKAAIDATAQDGKLALDATLNGLQAPGVGGLFAAAPVRLRASTDMAATAIAFTLDHPALRAGGTLRPQGESDIKLDVPALAPFATLGGVDARGSASVAARLVLAPALKLDATGTLSLTGGQAPLPGLIGTEGRFALHASRKGEDIALTGLSLDGVALHATAKGGVTGGEVALDWTLGLPALRVLAANLAGRLALSGHAGGKLDALTLDAALSGDVGVQGGTPGPVTAKLQAQGLPGAPQGNITVGGTLDGAPVELLATAARDAAGALRLDITRADWKSAHAAGALTLAAGAQLPQGRVTLDMPKLADLQGLLGRRIAGAARAELTSTAESVHLVLDGSKLDLAGSGGVGRVALDATLRDPLGAAVAQATLAIDGMRAAGAGTAGNLRLAVDGPQDALALKLNTDITGLAGDTLRAEAAATLNSTGRSLELSALQARWRDQQVQLVHPLRVDFADGATLDELALRLGAARLSVKGRVSPALDLTATLRDLPAGLAELADPGLKLAGSVSAEARLTGPPARPSGTVHLRATGLRATTGAAGTLKPAMIDANIGLAGNTAKLDARLQAGSDRLTLNGQVRLPAGAAAGALDLRAQGGFDLAALNAILAADGRQVAGRLALDARIGGSPAAPKIGGSLKLSGGTVQDIPLGLRIHDIQAEVTAEGETVRLASLSGRAGSGTIGASGSLSLANPMTLSLAITAKDAQLLASELVHGTLDADLKLQGSLPDGLAASGTIGIGRTEIRLPDTLPAGVAVLDVRRPGQAPPVAPVPGPTVALDIAIRAPGQVLVRGRGLDAELKGNLRILGSSADPRPQGRFSLVRGSFSLAGKTLAFNAGTLGFDGGLPVDPTLNFTASSTGGDITATLSVTGHASKPKITLSSVPELPQDEVLARLLFNKSAAALGPVELAQIAGALAQLAGGSGFDPLDRVRAGLGLDRLSVSGAGSGGTGAAVEAGRTLAPGIYLGAKQNTAGTGTKGTVEIELGRGFKLQAGVGSSGTNSATGASGSTSTDVGVTYQFDY